MDVLPISVPHTLYTRTPTAPVAHTATAVRCICVCSRRFIILACTFWGWVTGFLIHWLGPPCANLPGVVQEFHMDGKLLAPKP